MKKFKFVSRFAASVAAVALTLGSVVPFTACSDDDEIDNSGIKSRLDVPAVNAVSAGTDITKTSLTFSWEAVEGATGYQAQIRYSETGDIVREQISENTTLTFEKLNPGTQYFFRVCATYKYDEGRNSAYSAFVSATTEEADPTRPTFAVPAGVRCNMGATTENSLTFAWESVEGAEKYNVLLTAVGEDDRTFETTDTSYTFNGLTTGVKYFFQVQVAEIAGEQGTNASVWSGAVKATTTAKLETPQNLACKVKMAQAAQFVWDEVAGARTYQYELVTLTENGSSTTVLEGFLDNLGDNFTPGATVYATSTANTSISFFGLDKKTYYAFRVKAVAPADQTETVDSEFTDQYVFRTLEFDAVPLAIPSFSVTGLSQLQFMPKWKTVLNAYGFDFQIALASDVKAGNENGYVTRKIRVIDETTTEETAPTETNPLPLEVLVKGTLKDAYDETGTKEITLAPNTEYMIRMMTVADPAQMVYGDSQWSEWTTVKTLELAEALTLENGDDIEDMLLRVKSGAVITLKPGEYYTSKEFSIKKAVTIIGSDPANKPKINVKGFTLKETVSGDVLSKVHFENLELTGYAIDPATGMPKFGYSTAKTTSGGYVLDGKDGSGRIEELIIKNCTIHGFINALIRNEKKFQGFGKVTIEGNIVCIGGDNGYIFDANATPKNEFKTELLIKNNTFDGFGYAYGATKTGQMVRLPKFEGVSASAEIVNNTFYNIKSLSGKNLFEVVAGCSAVVSKNIITIESSITWTNGLGVNGTLTSTDNFIYNTTSTLEGFTVVDPQITDYEFLKNYKPTNADVIAAGAGDPRWLD